MMLPDSPKQGLSLTTKLIVSKDMYFRGAAAAQSLSFGRLFG
jgi:hypothetical protein